MRVIPRALVPVGAVLVVLLTAGLAQAALPSQSPDRISMFDGTDDLALGGGGVRVRAIAETGGGRVWVAGDFQEVDNSTGATQAAVNNLAAFTPSGTLDTSVTIPDVTLSSGNAIVYDMSLAPTGILYIAGNFDAVGGLPRTNVAAIDPNTGAVLPFAPGVGASNAIYASSSAIYVGTGKLLSFQPNGAKTPGYAEPTVIIDASIRVHTTIPQIRDITMVGNTLVAACQCDSVTDVAGTRVAKAVVEVDATTGNVRSWIPANLASTSAAFGVSVIVRNGVVYLAAGGSDFTAAYDLGSGTQLWKTDTSGSSQAIAWYQNQLIVGGHFDWTGSPTSNACGDNAAPNTACYHSPKLTAMNPATGAVITTAPNTPWNPGICCKYNGIWVITPSTDGATLHIGGEFERVGGTWSGSGTNWLQSTYPQDPNGSFRQKYYARLGGPPPTSQPLTLVKAGTGSGTVTSSPGGITCATACLSASAEFTSGQLVSLSASAAPGFTFTGWSGACSGSGACDVTLDAVRTVTAEFEPTSYALTIARTGTGTGTVTSDLAGINCGSTCASFFPENATVTLTAVAGPNAKFDGWSGSGCSGTATCVVSMDAAKNVSAAFSTTLQQLDVTKSGLGMGTVTSTPSGINCGATCTHMFSDATVTLTATPGGGKVFTGWSGGGCSGSAPTCDVTMDTAKTVNADFAPAKNLLVTVSGTGVGTVTSQPAGVSCTSPCLPQPSSFPFAAGTSVTLTATPDAASVFTGWSGTGGCTGTGTCTIVVNGTNAQRSVTATFAPAQTLTVSSAGSGVGTVTSNPGGVDCGLTCTANYASGNVTLTATPEANASFTGWSGPDGCPGTGTCTVSMTQARSVTATFTLLQRPLSVSVAGQGTVTDNPGPINCTTNNVGTCGNTYEDGTDVQLSATAAVNWTFTGWTGSCSGSETTCVVSMTGARSATATFEPISGTLFLHKAGSGTGSVTSSPSGIDCGNDCVEGYAPNAVVTLTATADAGSTFTGWSGGCTGSSATCQVTMSAARNVTADFELLHALSVSVSGDGSVTSDTGGISCPGTCVGADYIQGAQVTLTATPGAGSLFMGWSGGGCSGTSTCQVTMDADQAVTATFATAEDLTVAVDGNGTGGVTSAPGPIDCPGSCTHTYGQGSVVTLTANPSASSVFTGWLGGGCSGSASTCEVTMNGPQSVTATFSLAPRTLTVNVTGTGTGSVTSDVGGINCPGVCTTDVDHGTVVTLTAASAFNAIFTGWSGACSGTQLTCPVTMDGAKNVTATFTLDPTATCDKILFVSTRAGSTDIFSMNADGTGSATNLTASIGTDTDPSWSPDCSKIVFTSTRSGNADIWVMNANGTGLVQLTSDPASDTQPTWSGDSAKIAFVSARDGDQEIFTMNATNGSGLVQLTDNLVVDTAPDWSADGTKIVFMSKRLGTQIWVMNADGSNPVKRTSGLKVCDTPAFSPDGTKIVFTSTMSGSKQIWIGNATGTLGAVRLTLDGFSDTTPTFSPDGLKVAYSGSQSGNNEIWVVNANGSGSPSNRTNNAKSETLPNWSA